MVRLLRILELLSLLLLHILGQAVFGDVAWGERELGKHGWSPHVTQKLNASRIWCVQ